MGWTLAVRTDLAALATARRWRTSRGPEGDVVIESRILRQFGRLAPFVLAISLGITPGRVPVLVERRNGAFFRLMQLTTARSPSST
jgi:hypothetical protein